MRKVLISGCNSFTAKYMIPFLSQQDELRLYGTDLTETDMDIDFSRVDLTSNTETRELIDRLRPDIILNLAGLNKSDSVYPFFDINLTIARNILDAQNLLGIENCKTLFISSSAVYGNEVDDPVSENAPTFPVNAYGFSKLAMEQLALEHFNSFRRQIYLVRPFNLVGAGQKNIFVIPAFVQRVLKLKKSGETVMNTGNLESERDFLHVADAVRAYWMVVTSGEPGKIYNVGTGHVVQISTMLNSLIHRIGLQKQLQINKKAGTVDQINTIRADISRIGELGWEPAMSLDDALSEIVDYETDMISSNSKI